MLRDALLETKATEQAAQFKHQFCHLFLCDPMRILFQGETYSDFDKIEKNYGPALLQAFSYALTTRMEELRLNHELLQTIHKLAMSHFPEKVTAVSYKVATNNFKVHFQRKKARIVNPAGTLKGFIEFINNWLLNTKKPMHLINFRPADSKEVEYALTAEKGKLLWKTFLNDKLIKPLEKFSLDDPLFQVVETLLADPSYTCYINSGWDKIVSALGYPDVLTATREQLDTLFASYNAKIFKASPDEKLKIIVEHVQKISQVHPWFDGNVRTCYALLNRLLKQNGLSPTLLIDPNRLDCFDLEDLINMVKEGQEAFQAWSQGNIPDYVDPATPLHLVEKHPLIPQEIPDAKEEVEKFIQAITTPFEPKIYRKIVNLGPGETARLSAEHSQNTDILVRLQIDRRAIVFKDTQGNISVTHFARQTDYDFVSCEAAFMKGEYTIDIIKHADDMSNVAKEVIYAAIKEKLGKVVPNSKGNSDIRSTKTGNILLKQGKMLVPTNAHMEELLPINRGVSVITADNPFADSEITEGAIPVQVRLTERFIFQLAYKNPLPPTLVYHNGWTGQYSKLPQEVLEFLQQTYPCRTDIARLTVMAKSKALETFEDAVSNPATQALMQKMPHFIKGYWDCSARNLYTHLFGFFSAPPMPAKTLQLITEYCETEAAQANRTMKSQLILKP